jgi:hypothetical protein
MLSPKYHREQAQVLAGMALSADNPKEAERLARAASKHLARAQAVDVADNGAPHARWNTAHENMLTAFE